MQSKDLRFATERDLETGIGAATAPLDQRLEDLEVSAGFTPGDINDTTAASLIRNPESETATELSVAIAQQAAPKKVLEAPAKQSFLYGQFMKKLRTGVAATICVMGDSTVYGHDTVSADRVAPPTGTLPDGSTYLAGFTRSPAPWPMVMGQKLSEVYSAGVSVINRGYSGDYVDRAFTRWISPSGADLTIINFGINDAQGGAVPTAGNLEAYVNGYEKLIYREISDYNAAVVIMTPIRQRGLEGTAIIDVYRNALDALADKYGVPVIDSEPMLSGYNPTFFSDGLHLNTAGNAVMGARMSAPFIGAGPAAPFPVYGGTRLSVRRTVDNLVLGAGAGVGNGSSIGSITEGDALTGLSMELNPGESSFYSFYAATTDIVAVPSYTVGGGSTLTFSLDFGVEQPDNILDQALGENPSASARAASVVTHTGEGTFVTLRPESKTLRIASPGWHTLKISSAGGTSYAFGLEFMSWRTYASPRGVLHKPVPPAFDSSQPITTTRVKMIDVIASLGITDWGSVESYRAPALKVTVRSYGHRVIEYILTATGSPGGGGGIEHYSQLRSTALTGSPNEALVREIETVTWDNATRELVFTWKSVGKTMTQNFVMDITVL